MAEAIREGRILGVVNMVGCNNLKVLYEKTIVDVADVLLENGVLILTNGCALFPLMKLGYCNISALSRTNESLRDFLSPELPPFGTSANVSTTLGRAEFSPESQTY
ncbi:MAG: hypothetical protein IKK39_10445 [Thermoguttaceae bacterium]|nr:hypothetical protein [Thermoguttaceae bacterium]MBR4104464.1 hypothetical protein [Thermoguttaceae bacterium]